MLFDKNGEVISYDESDIFCDELMPADEHSYPYYYINEIGARSGKSKKKEIESAKRSMKEII